MNQINNVDQQPNTRTSLKACDKNKDDITIINDVQNLDTGMNYLIKVIDNQGSWFAKKSEDLMNYMGATDRSVRFLDPRAWYSELIMGTARWFTSAVTLLGYYPVCLVKDIKGCVVNTGYRSNHAASIISTPIYVGAASTIYLGFSVLCLGGIVVFTVGGLLSVTGLLGYRGLCKIGSAIQDGLQLLFSKAIGK